jgi:AGCS family alanine or glycine:cation symporter
LHALQEILSDVASFIWWPVLFLILGGGLFFLFHSGFGQYKYFVHAIQLLQGKHIDKDAPGQLSAYKALSTALASTVGMGNLAGVAAAIAMGGPGAMFWMWVTAIRLASQASRRAVSAAMDGPCSNSQRPAWSCFRVSASMCTTI